MRTLAICFVATVLLLFAALAFGGQGGFPFTSINKEPGDEDWRMMVEPYQGRCETTNFVSTRIVSRSDETLGWALWWGMNNRLVAARYALDGPSDGTANWVVYGHVEGTDIIIEKERAFDLKRDHGPCDWLDGKDA